MFYIWKMPANSCKSNQMSSRLDEENYELCKARAYVRPLKKGRQKKKKKIDNSSLDIGHLKIALKCSSPRKRQTEEKREKTRIFANFIL